jgi:hypothetical protein
VVDGSIKLVEKSRAMDFGWIVIRPCRRNSKVQPSSTSNTGPALALRIRLGTGPPWGVTAGYVFERSLDFFRADKHLDSGGGFYAQLQAGLEF